jgi:putative (di)nucleoside polyphosphate hydrolase
MHATPIKYRPNVAGILRNSQGKILICERLKIMGAWQFPQGGVDDGESHEEAIVRELHEEVGVQRHHYELREKRGPYRYLYGDGYQKRGFHGAEQHYFLADFTGCPSVINLTNHKPEFRDHRWIEPSHFIVSWLPAMKREVYRAVFDDFFCVKI